MRDILAGEASLEKLLESRLRADQQPVKLTVETRIRHDNECSARNSLLEIVTQDRPGSTAHHQCSIVGRGLQHRGGADRYGRTTRPRRLLSHREGQKLSGEQMRDLEWALAGELSDALPNW